MWSSATGSARERAAGRWRYTQAGGPTLRQPSAWYSASRGTALRRRYAKLVAWQDLLGFPTGDERTRGGEVSLPQLAAIADRSHPIRRATFRLRSGAQTVRRRSGECRQTGGLSSGLSLAFPLTMAQTYCTATYCSGLSAIALRRWISAQRSSALPGRRGSRRRADPRSSAPMEFVHGQHISGDAYRPSGRGAPIPASTRSRYSGITPARWTGTTTATSRLRCRPHGDLHSACRDTPVVRRGGGCEGRASDRRSGETGASPAR